MSSTSEFSSEDSDLVTSLFTLSRKSPKLVRSSTYPAPADENVEIRSWKMNEFKYYDVPSPFPTLARGLFTRELTEDQEDGEEGKGKKAGKRHQIVIRGYDKFFNIGEVPWTTWSSIETHTRAPYTLTLKSNGCIIFIAALSASKLLITSKHSLGPVKGSPISHAEAGEKWLRKYLKDKEKSEEDIAAELWEKDWTAIAELCDDSFEEHVLPYPPEKTGLHLHGLNKRTKDFVTMSTDVVDAFADKWGFIKTATKVLQSVKEVKDFTDSCAETGEWNGEPVEGFVVRTEVTETPTGEWDDNGGNPNRSSTSRTARTPYKPGSSFFFKVKFDEPYMMYRDWREVTKSLISSGSKNGIHSLSPSSLPKSKMKRPETKVYVKWVIGEMKKNFGQFDGYTKGHGIIKTRERFLEWLKSGAGEKDLEEEAKKEAETGTTTADGRVFGKTIIVPVAIPGCGKTAVSVALAHIFGFGHTQSDDVQVKKAAPVFIKNVIGLLNDHDVVIADKNNHLKQHREQLRDTVSKWTPPVRLIALDWSSSIKAQPPAFIHRICGDRVIGRGSNHQTLHADTSRERKHEEVIWMFLSSLDELQESEVDDVVEMSVGVEEGLEEQVVRAAKGIAKVLDLEEPSEKQIADALKEVEGYTPKTKKAREEPKNQAKGKAKNKGKDETRYYGLLPEVDLRAVLDERLAKEDVDEVTKAAWEKLKKDDRVTKRPHVTIVHRKGLVDTLEQEVWDRCAGLQEVEVEGNGVMFSGRLGKVIWNGRVMALTFEELAVAQDPVATESQDETGEEKSTQLVGQQGAEFVSKLPAQIRERLHITVGVKSSDIPAVEAKDLVEALRKGQLKDGTKMYEIGNVDVKGRIKGMFH